MTAIGKVRRALGGERTVERAQEKVREALRAGMTLNESFALLSKSEQRVVATKEFMKEAHDARRAWHAVHDDVVRSKAVDVLWLLMHSQHAAIRLAAASAILEGLPGRDWA